MAQVAIEAPLRRREYLAHSIAATLAVVVLPGALVYLVLFVLHPDPPLLVTSSTSLLLSALASAAGSALWIRNAGSAELSFGDLMLWQWWRRQRALNAIDGGTALLEGDVTRRSREDQLKALRRVNAALEAKDPYTLGHSKRVRLHAYRTGVTMRLSLHELEDLRLAAELHDVGKMMLSDRIIKKPGPLDDAEWAAMRRHSAVGAQMVEGLNNPRVVEAIRSHHERYDGSGYNDGLSGADIPLLARIIAVADAFDAITSTRSYRERSDIDKAREILIAEKGKQFDPAIVDAFLADLPRRSPAATLAAAIVPGLSALMRQGAVVAKRAGVASLVGGVGAAGASLAITASAFAPQDVPKPLHRASAVGQEKSTEGKARAEERSGGHAFSGAASQAEGYDPDSAAPGANVRGRSETARRGRTSDRPGERSDSRGPNDKANKRAEEHAATQPAAGTPGADNAADASPSENRKPDAAEKSEDKRSGSAGGGSEQAEEPGSSSSGPEDRGKPSDSGTQDATTQSNQQTETTEPPADAPGGRGSDTGGGGSKDG